MPEIGQSSAEEADMTSLQPCTIHMFRELTLCTDPVPVSSRSSPHQMFFPPQPFYSIENRGVHQTLWLVEQGKRIEPYTSPHMRLAFLTTKKDSTICTMWLRYPGATTTILFSHGNATDIGCMRDHLIDFARQLKVNVFAYDYTGSVRRGANTGGEHLDGRNV